MTTHSQVLWRCRRGMLELDLLLQDYANAHYLNAPISLQKQFLLLLEESDQNLQSWLLNGETTSNRMVADIIGEILQPLQMSCPTA